MKRGESQRLYLLVGEHGLGRLSMLSNTSTHTSWIIYDDAAVWFVWHDDRYRSERTPMTWTFA